MRNLRNILFASVYLISFNSHAQVVINEYSCANFSLSTDDYGNHEDWIELYNTSTAPANISGYYLSDHSSQPGKWKFPSGTFINGHNFLKVWASGRDEANGTYYHTNFSLSQTKFPSEQIILSDSSGNLIDHISILPTQTNQSRGRIPDGGPDWKIFLTTSPQAPNINSAGRDRYSVRPDANVPPGFYNSPVTISLATTELNASIHYTIDGTEPSAISPLYSSPVQVDTTLIIKAIAISSDPAIPPSFTFFGTYFINEEHSLPVVSVAGNDLLTLANGDANLKPVGSIEYFNMNHQRKTAGYGEFNRHGQDSWANDQRSIDFIMRDEMGYNYALEEQLFNLTPRDEFQRVILRAAGDDNYPAAHHTQNAGSAHLRDAYVQNLARSGKLDVDVRTATKAIVYMNGQYWGVYDLREIPDDNDYTQYYYGQGKYKIEYIETWGNTWAEYGGNQALTDWSNFHNYVMSSNVSDPVVWNNITSQLDVASLTDYVLVNSISVCSDWLNYNTGWWRGLDSTGTHKKWGYILWDNDAVFGFYINYTGIPDKSANAKPCDIESGLDDPEDHIGLLNKLRQNSSFNRYYISRYADLLNTTFSCDNMLHTLDSLEAVIDPEMDRHAQRWSGTYNEWKTNVQQLRDYIQQRCSLLPSLMDTCYNLTGPFPLTVNADITGAGSVMVNSLVISDFPWTGNYFAGLPVQITALPDTLNGITFDHWETSHALPMPSVYVLNAQLNISSADSVTAHFMAHSTNVSEHASESNLIKIYPSVINDKAEIEFYNKESGAVNISLCSLQGQPLIYINGTNTPAGLYQFTLDLSGKGISPGIYLLRIVSKNYQSAVKIVYAGN